MSTIAPPPAAHRSPAVARRPPRVGHFKTSGVLAAVAGMIVTALGAGIAIRHLTKTGLTSTSLLGLVVLTSGLTLLTFGWRVLWRPAIAGNDCGSSRQSCSPCW